MERFGVETGQAVGSKKKGLEITLDEYKSNKKIQKNFIQKKASKLIKKKTLGKSIVLKKSKKGKFLILNNNLCSQ